ncbi:transglutaminase-like cysteine peptidase [Pelagibacterium xiamenense]|uniref:transglutaminase-like cysteine peptidase n=1 Tax=Pelagibacterium xiamenense TaxID=2901140 RepID=UPI001E62CBB3|nr:transglutaminase-like cysteine peptidase [Pelagibacterium xiamenense]MCD7059351.1 transglutaminase-like cysteine peptidase [Pelagibacterium xiamenense]
MSRFASLCLAVACLATAQISMAHADTNPADRSHLTTVADYTPPLGFQLFCLANPGHCQGGGQSEIALTDALWAELQHVNASVNRAIRPRADSDDVWALGVSSGDCEDYVLAKRAMLIQAGVPASALRIGVGTYRGQAHAVLVVRTGQGDLVLDNMDGTIRQWNQTEINWIAMSRADPLRWGTIG